MSKIEWERQSREMESLLKSVEGDDDRKYGDAVGIAQKKMR